MEENVWRIAVSQEQSIQWDPASFFYMGFEHDQLSNLLFVVSHRGCTSFSALYLLSGYIP